MKYLDYQQLTLHHRKMALLEDRDQFQFMTEALIANLFDKVNELVQQVSTNDEVMFVGPIEHFMDVEDSVLTMHPGYDLDPGDDSLYDVVYLPDLFPFIGMYQDTIDKAVSRAKKRVVFGFYNAPDQDVLRLERWLTYRGYDWRSDEAQKPTYIVDKAKAPDQRLLSSGL